MTNWEPDVRIVDSTFYANDEVSESVSREPQRPQPFGVVSPSPDVDPAPSRDHLDQAVRLTRFAQLCLAFIVVCCGTAGLLILMYQGF